MMTRMARLSVRVLAPVALVAVPLLPLAADPPASKTTAKDVSKKVGDAGKAIKDYTVAQRDDAIKSAKAALDDADRRINRLERRLESDWERMDQAAREKARATLRALRKERNELAEWYGGLKHSSAEAWDQVKAGFAKSYQTLRESFVKAGKEFQN